MRIDAISIGTNPPDDVNVIIEVPLGGQPIKYEMDKEAGTLVVNTRGLVPGCVINVRPVGVLIMEDNAGQDEKIIAVPSHKLTKRYDHVMDHTDLPDITMQQVEHFFEHYKDLEPGKWVRIGGWYGAEKAKELIVESIERAKRSDQRASKNAS
ncbi:MAG: inorganic diphosphatase [Woeseiaceae bacterium]|nr:inorganic diphosphatase [Woeseiaceae bacterium]